MVCITEMLYTHFKDSLEHFHTKIPHRDIKNHYSSNHTFELAVVLWLEWCMHLGHGTLHFTNPL